MKLLSRCVPVLLACAFVRVSAATYDVRSFGAKGDGQTVDTPAINQAIAAAAKAGGGTVEFPAGNYLSYTIHLQSHVTLQLDTGATIVAAEPSPDLSVGYDAPEPNPVTEYYEDFGHSHWHNSLIVGENLEDIGITGPGRIFGKGLSRGAPGVRRDLLPEERKLPAAERPNLALPKAVMEKIAAQKTGPFGYPGRDTLPAGVGNKAIALKNCRNVIFRDFTIYHGGHFGILGTGVDNWTIDNLKIDTNRDGMDIDSCQNVHVSNCSVNSPNDDGICPKSSYALGYPRVTENVTITNCEVSGFDEGTFLDGTRQRRAGHAFGGGPTGRIKCGTESNGGFRNITISNCVFNYCRGLAFESVDGALMEDIAVSNITMRDIVNAPIFIRLGARLRGPDGTKVGTARRIKIDNIVAHNVAAQSGILIAGLKHNPIEDLTLSNIFIDYVGGGTKEQGERVVPEYDQEYPEPGRFGTIPAWGLWARYVKNFDVHHVEFRSAQEDLRPTVILDSVNGATLEHAILPHAAGVPGLWAKNVTDLTVESCPGLASQADPGNVADLKL
ncbi:MAG TPA: right-handed parallel beta-helix repeat-containing protein [Opitutaceae bacterium]|nr:right-handed parallel beta-helix repeat-containing protein [Opitutaceae bacterium]